MSSVLTSYVGTFSHHWGGAMAAGRALQQIKFGRYAK